MATAERPRAQLGRLMVDAGLLSEEQLELALEEQRRIERPLGEVIVNLGFASGGAVANALAEQSGAPLRTEHGFALGLSRLAPAEPAPAPPGDALGPIASLRSVPDPEAEVEEAPAPAPAEGGEQAEELEVLSRRVEELQRALMNARQRTQADSGAREELERARVERDEAVRKLAEETSRFAAQLLAIADRAQSRVAEVERERDQLAALLARPGAAAA